jgi:inner membrane protein
MMSLTHAAIASVGVSFALGDTSPLVLGLAIVGSQLPDMDTSTSLLGQILFPVSRWLEKRFPHRTLTHSFLATGAIALCSLPLYFYMGWKVWVALWLGHLISIFSDTCTKQGVQLFYPMPAWCVFGSNPNKRLTTGGVGEYWVLAIAVGLLVLNFQLTMNGGVLQATSQALGLKT